MSRILVVKLGAIGDVIMALPILRAVWESDPECQVDWVVGKVAAPILECVEDPRLRVVRVDERALFRGGLGGRGRAVLGLWGALGLARYDRILILNADPRYAILPMLCRGMRSWFRDGGSFRGVVPGRHHSVEYIRLLDGKDNALLAIPAYPQINLPTLPADVADRLDRLDGPLIAVSPAGAKNVMREEGLRRWHPEGYKAVIQALRERGCRVVLVGGPGDEWASEQLGRDCDLNLVGSLGLASFLTLLRRVDVVVTHDSGPLHMADLAGTPVVGIFGPTLAGEKRPIEAPGRMLAVRKEMACRPCYDGRRYAPCSDAACMSGVTSEEVVAAVFELLEESRREM